MPSNNAIVGQNAPASRMPSSIFKRAVPGFASMNYGRAYPVFVKYMEPRSKITLDVNTLIRGATPIAPVMGNSKMELTAFSVPWRIIWNYAKQFFGENDTSAWTQLNNYTKPQVELRLGWIYDHDDVNDTWTPTLPSNYDLVKLSTLGNHTYYIDCFTSDCYGVNKLADYLGVHPIPKGDESNLVQVMFQQQQTNGAMLTMKVDALPFRAFFSIINYYFRDQNYQAPYLFSKDNGDLLLGNYHNEAGRLPMPYDFMVSRSIGSIKNGNNGLEGSSFVPPASRLKDPFSTIVPEPLKGDQYDLLSIAGLAPVAPYGTTLNTGDSRLLFLNSNGNNVAGKISVQSSGAVTSDGSSPGTYAHDFDQTNLYADLAAASKITLEKFRDFVVLNQFSEKCVKGTRYAEFLQEFYGVPVNPALLDEPRFLGGVSIPIASWQVAQSAPDSNGSGVGELGAFTHTKDESGLFTFNFDEPSILMVIAVARVEHMFSQQLDPHWLRKDKYDEHYPLFDGLGYQPLYPSIVAAWAEALKQNGSTLPTVVNPVGFQDYAWEERYQLGNSAGVLNPTNPYSLDYFVYNERTDRFFMPGPELISAYRDADIVDRTLQLGDQASLYGQQLLVNFSWDYIEAKMISKSGKNPGLDRI